MAIDKLSDTQIRNVRPREKIFRLHDGLGLYLEVTPTGNRWWRFKYTFGGKEKRVSLGVYPHYWVPGVNNLGRFGRWAFAEFTDVYLIEEDFRDKVAAEFESMLQRL